MERAENKSIIPPFDKDTALLKVQNDEAIWNKQNPIEISQLYSADSECRIETQFLKGRKEIYHYINKKLKKEKDFKIKRELWGFRGNRMAVHFIYEFNDEKGQWYRAYGNELLDFTEEGLISKCHTSINKLTIKENERILM